MNATAKDLPWECKSTYGNDWAHAEGCYSVVSQPGGFLRQCDETVMIGIDFEHPLVPTAPIHHMLPAPGNSMRGLLMNLSVSYPATSGQTET